MLASVILPAADIYLAHTVAQTRLGFYTDDLSCWLFYELDCPAFYKEAVEAQSD